MKKERKKGILEDVFNFFLQFESGEIFFSQS